MIDAANTYKYKKLEIYHNVYPWKMTVTKKKVKEKKIMENYIVPRRYFFFGL